MSAEQKHTPEPWRAHPVLGSVYAGDKLITDIALAHEGGDGGHIHANAARIVACVNYCAGMADDDISEQGGAAKQVTATVAWHQIYLEKLEQRDRLLQVARDFNEALGELGLHCECGEAGCRTTRLRAALAECQS
jgi:hypothetical protein